MKRNPNYFVPLIFILVVGLLLVAANIKYANDTASPEPRVKHIK